MVSVTLPLPKLLRSYVHFYTIPTSAGYRLTRHTVKSSVYGQNGDKSKRRQVKTVTGQNGDTKTATEMVIVKMATNKTIYCFCLWFMNVHIFFEYIWKPVYSSYKHHSWPQRNPNPPKL